VTIRIATPYSVPIGSALSCPGVKKTRWSTMVLCGFKLSRDIFCFIVALWMLPPINSQMFFDHVGGFVRAGEQNYRWANRDERSTKIPHFLPISFCPRSRIREPLIPKWKTPEHLHHLPTCPANPRHTLKSLAIPLVEKRQAHPNWRFD
jgi:hypothetical protein